jgi:hypothetical protein
MKEKKTGQDRLQELWRVERIECGGAKRINFNKDNIYIYIYIYNVPGKVYYLPNRNIIYWISLFTTYILFISILQYTVYTGYAAKLLQCISAESNNSQLSDRQNRSSSNGTSHLRSQLHIATLVTC